MVPLFSVAGWMGQFPITRTLFTHSFTPPSVVV